VPPTPGPAAEGPATEGLAIEVSGLVVRYGPKVAVDGLDLTVEAGQVVTVLGPNGAGKTSTVEVLEGYRRPAAGRVRVLGLDPQKDHRALTARIGVMLQRGGVYPGMDPAEALRLFASYYDHPDDPGALLGRVGLRDAATTPWRRLSGGQQQRLSLALALVGRPEVAFLDEPTAGVDPEGRLAIRQVIRDLQAGGTAVLLTTHELEEAERLADRLVIVDRGQVVASGTPSELRNSTGITTIRFAAPAGLDLASLANAVSASVSETAPGQYVVEGEVQVETRPATIAALAGWLAAHGHALTDLQTGGEPLEDVYLRLTGHGQPSEQPRIEEPELPSRRSRRGTRHGSQDARSGRSR
jgi:ABC-2 type transport system ATP-binding protein